MASTSGSKRPLGPPSPPTPPPHRLRQEEHIDADKPPSREGKEVPADDDDPPPETSQEALRRRQDAPRVFEHGISRLNCLLLQVSDDHHESLPNLSEIVARIFQTEGWRQLLENLLQAIHTDFETRQETALRVLPCLPEKQACEFFKDNYRSLYVRFLDLFDSPNVNIQALTFDASSKLISLKTLLSLDGDIERLLLKMFVWLQLAFRNGSQIDILESRITHLVVFAIRNAHHVDKSLHSVLTCMFEIFESADDNFITCRAIEIIMMLRQQKLNGITSFVRELSKESKRRILEKCVRLMFRVEDVPSWYDMDAESSEHMGLLGSYQHGKFLLHEVSSDSKEELLLPFGIEMIPQCLNSEDWKTRHAGVIAFSLIAKACAPEKICEQTERVVDISLDDPHPRVRWAAIQVILSSISDHPKEHVQYLIKFLPRLVNIIRSSASIYPRVQFEATIAVRQLINNCDNEGYVRSFSEDLVPELLKILEQGVMFRFHAMEILRSLAISFPVVFRSHYKETVDSLKPHVSQWLLGAKSIECLSYIFSWFLRDQSLFVLSDAEKVFTIVFKILDSWKSINNRVKIHILRALSHLCKLPQTDKLLNKTMPVLIQILENTKDSNMTTLTIDKKQIPTLQMTVWACDLLSSFAVRFQEQFALWASRVSGLLTSLFMSTDDNGFDAAAVKFASVKALPNVFLSCQHKKEYQELINSTVRALVQASQKETERAVDTEMLKSLNACIGISGSVFNVDVIKQIAVAINQQLSQGTIYWPFNLHHSVYEMKQQEKIIQAAIKCLETMIKSLKTEFLPHVDELLPAVQALWSHDSWCSYKLKEVAISIFNLLLKDCPYKLQRYRDTYLQVVMDLCHSESLQLQREAARGIGLCATNTQLISNFDALKAINNLYHVIGCALESERRMTYDAAVSALGKICEFRHGIINGPQVVPIWINFLPLRNDFEEAKYAHQQLCRLLETADSDILELDNKNLEMLITQILNKILLQSDYIATEETICSIISFLTQEKIREQTERVVDVSLADPHPRVHWAAIEAIFCSASDHKKEHVQYLTKFLPRLVTIIRSSASIYPRVQFHATRAVRHLINYCDHEDDVTLFSEDLVPELLKFLKNFRDEAMEILRSLAVSFPVVFRGHYQETRDSLKPLVSRSLLGVKSIESLSYIFSRFLREPSLFLPSNAEEVFTIVFKILDDWTDTDDRIKIHILKALSQLCKLPQTDEFLNKTMPVFIQILKNTKDPTMTTLTIDKEQIPSCPEQRILACDLLSNFAVRFQEQFAPWASRVSPLLTSQFRSNDDDDDDDDRHVTATVKISSITALPSVLLSCLHRKEAQGLINSTVQALVNASQKERKRAIEIEMLKSLNACIAISGSVFNVDAIKQIAVLIHHQLSQGSLFANLEHVTDYEMEQEEEIVQAAKCLETMINTLKYAFLPHVDELLPAVEALWGPDNEYPDKVKEVAISIFNLLLKDYPYKLQRYRDTYPLFVMDFCESESPQLQREAACGIGLCATHRELISNFDALEAIKNLYHVIERAMESERRMTYDAAVSALGKICEFRHDAINGPEVIPIWLNFWPLRNDCEEAKYAHQQLCRLLEKADPDLLGLNNENLNKITQILREILLQSDYIATEETTCSIIYLLTQLGAMP